MKAPLVLFLPLLLLGSAGRLGPQPRPWPAGLPSDALLATWEKVDGWVEEVERDTRYTFWVDPQYPALYRLTHYQVSVLVPGSSMRQVQFESLLWNGSPGRREPVACYRWRSWTPGETAHEGEGEWERLVPDTEAYRGQIWEVLRVYDLHRKVLQGR